MNNKKYFTLNHKVIFYVPSTTYSKAISDKDFKARTTETATIFSAAFGGASIETVTGFYKAESGLIITETINKVISFCSDEQLKSKVPEVLQLASDKRREWQQESIGLEVDNQFLLID